MSEFFTCLISKNGMAYLTGLVIFFLTLFLTSRKYIGFTFTFLFLIFALVAALAVSNQDLLRNYFAPATTQPKEGVYQGNSTTEPAKQSSSETHGGLQQALEDLKAEFLIEKARLQTVWEDFIQKQQSQKKKEESANSEKKD